MKFIPLIPSILFWTVLVISVLFFFSNSIYVLFSSRKKRAFIWRANYIFITLLALVCIGLISSFEEKRFIIPLLVGIFNFLWTHQTFSDWDYERARKQLQKGIEKEYEQEIESPS